MWRERRKIVEIWRGGRAAALATLVAVEGSSYRRPGARLLVAKDGGYAGSISGGCLEAEVVRKARWLVRDGAAVQHYSTAMDDASEIPYGLGCGGSVEVLLEPAGTPEFQILMDALARSLEGETSEIDTTLPAEGRALSRVVRTIATGITSGTVASDTDSDQAEPEIYSERIEPPQRVLVFGAGDDAHPLANMADLLGWRVIVVDGRANMARPERFPAAERVVVADPDAPLGFPILPNDFAVVMTHSYEQDRAWLHRLLPARLQYLGLLGARHRSALLAGEIAALLAWPLQEVCDRLRAPVGLDLGGDGAEAIALAIIAEMQACAAHRPILSRRMTPAIVAEQIAQGSDTRRYETQCAL
ncbi:XdhC family protein [Terriglobus sp.]|uniref:XdhC family protein n=1 Tax=Terriglobus sp. TaxID=1889013 RepID=UPI003AFFD1E9